MGLSTIFLCSVDNMLLQVQGLSGPAAQVAAFRTAKSLMDDTGCDGKRGQWAD